MTYQSSHLHILPIFQTKISPELMQIFANVKRRFDSIMEFYVIHLNIKGYKIDHSTTLKTLQKIFLVCAQPLVWWDVPLNCI